MSARPVSGVNIVTFTHGAIPPSLNEVGTRGNRWEVNKAKKEWEQTFSRLLLVSHMPQHLGGRPEAHHLTAVAYLRFPDRRRRDEGNFSWLIEKALGDALVGGFAQLPPAPGGKRNRYVRAWPEGRFLPDDNSKHFRFRGVRIVDERGPRQMKVVIRWWPWPPEPKEIP